MNISNSKHIYPFEKFKFGNFLRLYRIQETRDLSDRSGERIRRLLLELKGYRKEKAEKTMASIRLFKELVGDDDKSPGIYNFCSIQVIIFIILFNNRIKFISSYN